MAESDTEKTEAATPRRLEKARQEGQVARSRELNTFAMLAVGLGGLWLMGEHLAHVLMQIMRHSMGFGADRLANPDTSDPTHLFWQAGQFAAQALISLAGWLGLLAATAVGVSLALGGLVLSTQALAPKFGRLNPIQGLARLFSAQAAVELFKTLSKVALIGAVGGWVIRSSLNEWLGLARAPLFEALVGGVQQVALACGALVGTLLFIVLLDVPWQLWSHFKKLRMSREELKQEHKESEGDPQIKGRIRQMQRAVARRRMMAAVPAADVVVTNPQHYAVALSYQAQRWQAPRVVAKGSGLVAARIRALAEEHRVPYRSCGCRRWGAPCITTWKSATRFPRRCLRRWPKCWYGRTSCATACARTPDWTSATTPPRSRPRRRTLRCRQVGIRWKRYLLPPLPPGSPQGLPDSLY